MPPIYRPIRNADGSYTIALADDESVLVYPFASESLAWVTEPPSADGSSDEEQIGSPKGGPRVTAYVLRPQQIVALTGIRYLPQIVTPSKLRIAASRRPGILLRPGFGAVANFAVRPNQRYDLIRLAQRAREADVYVRLLTPDLPDLLER